MQYLVRFRQFIFKLLNKNKSESQITSDNLKTVYFTPLPMLRMLLRYNKKNINIFLLKQKACHLELPVS